MYFLKALFLAFVLCLTISPASAEPIDRWWSGWGMGVFEYGYRSDSAGSDTIYISCSDDWGTNIRFTIGGKDPEPISEITVVIDGKELRLFTNSDGSVPTESHLAASNFWSLWEMIRSGQTMWVKLSTGESTTFPLKGSAKALPREHCKTDFAR